MYADVLGYLKISNGICGFLIQAYIVDKIAELADMAETTELAEKEDLSEMADGTSDIKNHMG